MLPSFWDELEKIALSQKLLMRARTKALRLAEKFGQQGDKWRVDKKGFSSLGIKLKDPQRSEKAYAKARKYSRIGQAIKAKLKKEPQTVARKGVERGRRKQYIKEKKRRKLERKAAPKAKHWTEMGGPDWSLARETRAAPRFPETGAGALGHVRRMEASGASKAEVSDWMRRWEQSRGGR